MASCPACGSGTPDGSRYCPSCATPLEVAASGRTETSAESKATCAPIGGGDSPGRDPSLVSLDRSRFLPGTMLAGRYRIIGLLGKGGMGEVYRADDLKLGQPVALKFLPAGLEQNPSRLARLLNEVRLARQVSHPNVCRVYDVGEVDGHHFLSMEFVDGENLASLLRQIGRFPRDKAVQIARQLCAGLAAAHEQGILHRDLKPANVMIDGRGRVRITDFGLADIAGAVRADDVGSGTPGYMAPEQLAGKEVSVRSDIYSLGLVLYEMFTGRQAFQADTLGELRRLQEAKAITSPSSHVEGLHPAVERVILRCLERDPAGRPASALGVAASLPGGDPLAAALAAGETPSPEMVAEAGGGGSLPPWIAAACVVVIAFGIAITMAFFGRNQLVLRSPPRKPPADLAVEARQIIAEAGHAADPVDSARGFTHDGDRLEDIKERDSSATRWDQLHSVRPAPILFWYRQSPRSLVTLGVGGNVTEDDPPPSISGMVNVRLDAAGRLLSFLAVPPQLDESEGPAAEADWSNLFRRAGLGESSSFTPAHHSWNPLVDCDTRQAWTGAYPEQPDVPVRVEAGSYRGEPVYFEVVLPWSKPWRQHTEPWKASEKAVAVLGTVLLVFMVGGAVLLARRNLRRGRADRHGAFRLAAFLFFLSLVQFALQSHHVAEFAEIGLIFLITAFVLLSSALVWLVFVALEPYVRRLWPEVLISWNRLLAGRLRDPRIGRDVLVGGVAFAGTQLLALLSDLLNRWMGMAPPMPMAWGLYHLSSARARTAIFLGNPGNALVTTILILFLVLLLRVILRRQWAAIGGFLLLMVFVPTLMSENPKVEWIIAALYWGTTLFVLIRFGLVASVCHTLFEQFAGTLPLLSHFPAWYAQPFVAELLAAAALAAYGFLISLGGRPLFAEDALEVGETVGAR